MYERMVPGALRGAVARSVAPYVPGRLGRYVRRSFLAMDRTPEAMFLDNFASIHLNDQRKLFARGLRDFATVDDAYADSLAYFHKPNGGSTLEGCDGHGNLNAHILAGFVPTGSWIDVRPLEAGPDAFLELVDRPGAATKIVMVP